MSVQNAAIKGIEQGRAAYAYKMVEDAAAQLGGFDSKESRKYKSYVRKIPMLIKTNGLGASFAFIKSKSVKEKAYCLIYNKVSDWLKDDDRKKFVDGGDLVKSLIALDSPEYRAVTGEVISLFNWLRRFAEGLIEGEVEDA